MSKFRKKPAVIEAITFEELVAHGIASVPLEQLHSGIPWSFDYLGNPITHETDNCYLIPVASGGSAKLWRGDMLCAQHIGDGNSFWWDLWPVDHAVFAETYEPVGPASQVRPLSSDFLDAFRDKLARGETLTHDEASQLLSAHDSLLEAYHETAPVRNPAPPSNQRETEQLARLGAGDLEGFRRALLESVQLYADTEAGRSGMGSPVLARMVYAGIERQIDMLAVRGVRDPSPPEPTDREIGLRSALNAALVDLRIFRGVDDHFVQALEKLVEQTGVRGAGVVPPEEPK